MTRAEKGEVVTELVVTAPKRIATDGVAVSPGTPGAPAAILYEVQELKVNLGDQVQAGQALCLLANHQRLFVEGRAFKSEAGALASAAEKKVPIRVEFADETPGEWPALEPLVIHHLSNQVDPPPARSRSTCRSTTSRARSTAMGKPSSCGGSGPASGCDCGCRSNAS